MKIEIDLYFIYQINRDGKKIDYPIQAKIQ